MRHAISDFVTGNRGVARRRGCKDASAKNGKRFKLARVLCSQKLFQIARIFQTFKKWLPFQKFCPRRCSDITNDGFLTFSLFQRKTVTWGDRNALANNYSLINPAFIYINLYFIKKLSKRIFLFLGWSLYITTKDIFRVTSCQSLVIHFHIIVSGGASQAAP